MRKILTLGIIGLSAIGAVGFSAMVLGADPKPANDVKEIKLPEVPPNLPRGEGLEAVNAACVICHSTRYISMQPPLPRKTWVAVVDKMRKTFGAPVSDEQAVEIVEYLVKIRGADEAPKK